MALNRTGGLYIWGYNRENKFGVLEGEDQQKVVIREPTKIHHTPWIPPSVDTKVALSGDVYTYEGNYIYGLNVKKCRSLKQIPK
jgi:hypothetical protein